MKRIAMYWGGIGLALVGAWIVLSVAWEVAAGVLIFVIGCGLVASAPAKTPKNLAQLAERIHEGVGLSADQAWAAVEALRRSQGTDDPGRLWARARVEWPRLR